MDEQPQQPDSTNAVSTLSVLGRTFLSADDAACYAHERVGRRRNRGYYGYILQRDDQRYVITEPAEQLAGSSTHHERVPDNHVLHSRFYAHPALSTLDAHEAADLEWSVEDAATSLLMFNVKALRNSLATDLSAYLSGAEDSLIRFTPDSSRSQALLKQLGTSQSPGKLALDLEKGVVKPEQLVTEAAAAGDLQVIISNGRWRPRGKVTEHFVPGPWERNVPERVSLGAVFQSADAAALDRYARNTGQRDEGQTWFGFILKHRDKEEYVASELVPVSYPRDKLFLERSVFRRSPTSGDYVYPESFAPHSYFYSRQRVNHERDAPRRWLAEHFIVPKDLWVAVYNAKKRPVFGERVPALLYVSTPDGALLKYVPRPDTPLFDNDVPNMGLEAIQNNLAKGVSSATDFVATVARNDALHVLRTSVCWDRKGLVGAHWAPSQNVQRRSLGPVFLTADDAAVHARSQVPAGTPRAFTLKTRTAATAAKRHSGRLILPISPGKTSISGGSLRMQRSSSVSFRQTARSWRVIAHGCCARYPSCYRTSTKSSIATCSLSIPFTPPSCAEHRRSMNTCLHPTDRSSVTGSAHGSASARTWA